ncbi:MAG: Uma2 family endonuclease [Spirochaetes bacterium]|nr:Uma2 family endonuclease [Spirochaetota bacterium]
MATAAIESPPARKNHHGLRVTREEYLDLIDDGNKYDMIDGVLYMTPSPFFEHNLRGNEFNFVLKAWLKGRPMGEVVMETDVLLPDGGDVLRPDISFILNENMGIVKGHIHGVPDLVCEVLSESTRRRDLGVKAERYRKNGVKEYFIIDPDEKSIHLWINRGDAWAKSEGETLKSELLPGFVLEKKQIFG